MANVQKLPTRVRRASYRGVPFSIWMLELEPAPHGGRRFGTGFSIDTDDPPDALVGHIFDSRLHATLHAEAMAKQAIDQSLGAAGLNSKTAA